MQQSSPRFEFRAFAKNFGIVEQRLRSSSRCEQIRESAEIYILSAGNDRNNTKLRADKMDIKELIAEARGLEQWRPRMQGAFPLSAATLRDEVFPAFAVCPPALARDTYSLEKLLTEVVRPHPQLVVAQVFKRRFGFTVNGCIVELAEVWINGAGIQTAAVESTDPAAVLATRASLALDVYENVNYLRAIKRVVGMQPMSP